MSISKCLYQSSMVTSTLRLPWYLCWSMSCGKNILRDASLCLLRTSVAGVSVAGVTARVSSILSLVPRPRLALNEATQLYDALLRPMQLGKPIHMQMHSDTLGPCCFDVYGHMFHRQTSRSALEEAVHGRAHRDRDHAHQSQV